MAKVELKQPIVDEISGILKDAQSLVLVDYRGITVEEDTKFRRVLREAGIEYKVFKNTLIKRAVAGTPFEPVSDLLEGPTAIAVSNTDATAPARVISENAKTIPSIEIKGGIVENEFYDAAAMEAIATIPSREILLGKLLGSIQSPVSNFARVLSQIAEHKEEVA